MTNDGALRRMPRETTGEARERRALPDRPPDRTWGGRAAEGARCAVCDARLARGEAELELEFLSPDGAPPDTYRIHPRCFALWDLARRGALLEVDGIAPDGRASERPDGNAPLRSLPDARRPASTETGAGRQSCKQRSA